MPKKPKRAKPPKTAVKDATHLRLRIRDGLLAELQAAADLNERTLTNEITRRLERSISERDFLVTLNAIILAMTGEFEQAKKEISVHAPDTQRTGQATARVLAMLARRLWPECRWVRVSAGLKPEDDPAFTCTTSSLARFEGLS